MASASDPNRCLQLHTLSLVRIGSGLVDCLHHLVGFESFLAAFRAEARILDPAERRVGGGDGEGVDPHHPAFTENGRRANLLGDAIESGMVGINTFAISTADAPFGGVKDSGFGSEGGKEGLETYQVVKAIHQA